MNHHIVGAYLIAAHLWAAPAAGQATSDGQLRGTVRDATGAIVASAAVVIASSQLIGGPRPVTVGPDGQWRALALPPGEYTVTVTASGFDAVMRDRVRVIVGATLIIDVELAIAPLTERTLVEFSGPAVDVTSASVPYTLGAPLLRGLPTSRTFSDLINLTPGVAGDQAFGGSKRSNGLYIDGLDTTESSEQEPWLRFNQNWLQEVQIVGLGAEAEYGLSTGVTAFGLVRTGTNRYSGLAEAWTVPGEFVATNTEELSQELQRQFSSARIDSFWNANGQMGGPLQTDRLWFFAGLDHTTKDGAPAGYQGSDSQQEEDTRGIGKLTWQARPATRLEGFVQGGRRRIRNFGLSFQTPREAAWAYAQPQIAGTARVLHSVGSSLLFEWQYAGSYSPETYDPQPPASRAGPPGHYDQVTGTYSVNVQYYLRNQRWRHTTGASGTWYGSFGGLNHDLELGLQIERAREETSQGYPGGRAYDDLGSVPDLVYLWDGSVLRGDTARLTLFLQDRLQLGPRVTLSPGLRIDHFHWSTAETSDVLVTTPVSPRLGVAWDVRSNHRTVVRAHYGRYTDPAFAQPVLLTDYANRPAQITARVIAPDVFEEISRQVFSGRSIDSDIQHSFVDQFVGGLEHQLTGNITVLGQYIHREFGSFMAYQTDNVAWLPVERRDPGPDGVQGTGDEGALFTVYSRVTAGPANSVYTNLDNAWRQYRGAQFVLRTTALGPWQVQGSYTRSQTRGTMSTALHVNAGVRFQGATNPNRLINGDSVTGFDPTNEFKVLSVWNPERWGGWVLSGVYRYLTGGAWGRTFLATGLAQGNQPILAEPRGTRRLPAINQLDLHVEKTIRLGSRTLGGFVDVFNVWNQGVPDSEWGDPVKANSGPDLGVPTLWRLPRQVRAGMQLTF